MNEFKLHRVEHEGSVVLHLSGDLDMAVSPLLREEFQDAFELKPKRIIVSMKDVTLMDSSGTAVLIEALRYCRKNRLGLALAEPSGPVRQVLELARLDEGVFEILDRVP